MLLSPGCLAWLVFVVGSVVGGRVAFASTEKHDELDGELVCRLVGDDKSVQILLLLLF